MSPRIGWLLAGAGAVCVLTGVLPSGPAGSAGSAGSVLARVAPVLGFLAAVTVVAELADAAGLFDVAAGVAARLGGGRVPVLWLLVVALATVTTVLLSLDTTAVLLTPVVLALADRLGLPPLPFAMTTVWLANTASLLLPISNLTNLLATERLGGTALTWAGAMWAPALVAVAATVGVLWLLHRRELTGRYVLDPARVDADDEARDGVLLGLSAACCLGLGVAVGAGVAPWQAAGVAAVVLAGAFAVRARGALRASFVPWQLVISTVGIFLVVAALDRHGLGTLLRDAAGSSGSGGPSGSGVSGSGVSGFAERFGAALRTAATGAASSNVVNNLPAYLAVEPAAVQGLGVQGLGVQAHAVQGLPVTAGGPARLLGLVVGTNAGPLLTVWASLATLLWRERCRARGLVVPAGRFALEGLALVVPLLLACCAALALTAR